MAIGDFTLREKMESRPSEISDSSSQSLLYDMDGTASDLEAKAAALAGTPTVYDGLLRQVVNVDPQTVDTVTNKGLWLVTAKYGVYVPPETGDSSFEFDTGGGTQHITHALATVLKKARPGKVAADFKGAIGVTHDSVEGVDITVPVYTFSETHYLASAAVTDAYKVTLFYLTGKVNSAGFRGLASGECLFLGARGAKRAKEQDWEITFRFAGSPNVTGLTIGMITGIDKNGWEYLWVRYADAEDTGAKQLVKVPIQVNVEKVYELGNFASLGIGG